MENFCFHFNLKMEREMVIKWKTFPTQRAPSWYILFFFDIFSGAEPKLFIYFMFIYVFYLKEK